MTVASSASAVVFAAVAVGGALGAMARHAVNLALKGAAGAFPLSTLVVNAAGSMMIGLLVAWAAARGGEPGLWRGLVQVGLLGSLTTYSTFSVETLVLAQSGRPGLAGLSVLANLCGSLAACWLGLTAGRTIW